MCDRMRLAGQFISKRKKLWKENLSKAHKKTENYAPEPPSSTLQIEGRRIVELKLLGEGLWCSVCQIYLLINNTVKESIRGLASVLLVRCHQCGKLKEVPTSKISNETYYDVNCKMALGTYTSGDESVFTATMSMNYYFLKSSCLTGTLDAGIGLTHANAFLSALNIPAIHPNLFKRYERFMGSSIEKVANASCRESIKLEKALTEAKITSK